MLRLVVGWGAYAVLAAFSSSLTQQPPAVTNTALAAIIAIIIFCAFGVVHEAEHLARKLGDPYGTLVLTLAIVLIEVVLISAVMLGPGEHDTIARDSVMGATMIVLGLVTGLALVAAGLAKRRLRVNRAGMRSYFAMLVILLSAAFVLPALIGIDGAFTTAQAIPVVIATVVLYAGFLYRQTGARARDFQEPQQPKTDASGEHPALRQTLQAHRGELAARIALLIATVLPIVLLSHDMATLLDETLEHWGAPLALSGVLIALIVFLPEGITTVRAARQGEGQRVSNLAHGALVSCVGLTLPVVLVIGMLTKQTVTLAESPLGLAILVASLTLTAVTFLGQRLSPLHGVAHLAVFAAYLATLFVTPELERVGVDHEAVAHVSIHDPLPSRVDLISIGCDELRFRVDPVFGTELEHLLNLGDATRR